MDILYCFKITAILLNVLFITTFGVPQGYVIGHSQNITLNNYLFLIETNAFCRYVYMVISCPQLLCPPRRQTAGSLMWSPRRQELDLPRSWRRAYSRLLLRPSTPPSSPSTSTIKSQALYNTMSGIRGHLVSFNSIFFFLGFKDGVAVFNLGKGVLFHTFENWTSK